MFLSFYLFIFTGPILIAVFITEMVILFKHVIIIIINYRYLFTVNPAQSIECSVIEPNGTHPKIFPIEHNQTCGNRTLQQLNIKLVSSGFKQGVVGGSSGSKKERGRQGIH